MKYSKMLLTAAVLWLAPTTMFAQAKQKPAIPAAPASPVVGSPTDTLNAEDLIAIQVGNHSELDQTVYIEQDGKITLHELGQFVAAGKTRDALRAEIQVQADKTLNNAPIFVVMKERRLPHFSIDGDIGLPGVFTLSPGMKILDGISAGHGLRMAPNRYRLKLIRKGMTQPLDVTKIYGDPEGDVNMTLQPNDKLVFSEIELVHRRVTVLGQVGRPSTYEADNDTTVLTLLGQAGGISQAAALTKVTVTRGSTVIPLNLRPVLVKGTVDDAILKFRFEDGDVLSVPGVETKYQVLGQVGRPASYVLPEQATVTVLDALNAAGGATGNANLKGAFIRRMVNGKSTDVKVDFESINKKGSSTANVLVQADDTLVVPQRGKKGITIGDVLAPISILNLLGFRFLGR